MNEKQNVYYTLRLKRKSRIIEFINDYKIYPMSFRLCI